MIRLTETREVTPLGLGASRISRKPKLPRRFASPASAGVSKGTRVLVAEQPSDPRNRHAIFLQIADGQTFPELLQYFAKCHTLFGEPPHKRPLAHPELAGDNFRLCL